MSSRIQQYWNRFLTQHSNFPNIACKGTICFGDDRASADRACQAVLSGTKTAFSYPAHGYRTAMKGMPAVGDLNIVVNWDGEPICVIETLSVHQLCLDDVDERIILEFGCDDAQAWREAKGAEFKKELDELGLEFDGKTVFLMEIFRTIQADQA